MSADKSVITADRLRAMYLSFFESKGHMRIPSAPLVPSDDPSVLFTTAGMHPLVPYLKGQAHPQGKRLVNVQKCLRTTDIDEVGDSTHATMFEMLGNWSLGDYFKEESITWSWEFVTSSQWLGVDPLYIAVSVFAGDEHTPRDEESADIWKRVGVSEKRIAYLGKEDNWWPAGGESSGPQGPDSEIFYWSAPSVPPDTFDPSDDRWVEIWNNVFMEYDRAEDGTLVPLKQKNVDTGMGLERVVMVLGKYDSIYDTDSFANLIKYINTHTQKNTDQNNHVRIIADHVRAATFILGDEHSVTPSNTDRGYVLRRLIRRAVRSVHVLGIQQTADVLMQGAHIIVEQYGNYYPSIASNVGVIEQEIRLEVERFESALKRGLVVFDRIIRSLQDSRVISGKDAFLLYESYGFPLELTSELAFEQGISVDVDGFHERLSQHQEQSRASTKGKFSGGLADHAEETVRMHTATHLLHAALRNVLGPHVQQKGSNITSERLRFDFSHPEKLTDDQKQRVEQMVNTWIQEDISVVREVMDREQARGSGALGLFEEKYGDRVSVYIVKGVSKELCGGPHVSRTGEIGMFTITKEEAASAGVRRIKAVVQKT